MNTLNMKLVSVKRIKAIDDRFPDRFTPVYRITAEDGAFMEVTSDTPYLDSFETDEEATLHGISWLKTLRQEY